MLVGEDIVCLAHEPWHGPWKTYHQIMALLAESNRVLYVGPPRPLRGALGGLVGGGGRPTYERVTDMLTVYHEPWLLARARGDRLWSGPFNRTTTRLRLAQVRWLARKHGMHSPILWVFDPSTASAVGTFREKLVIFYMLDNYVEFFPHEATAARAAMTRNEATMLAKADLVFAVSEGLYRRCLRVNPRSFLVPNGVDYDRFQATTADGEAPPDMRAICRPILGYVGALQSDLNFPLLERLAAECPQWSMVFVGPDELGRDRQRFQALIARPNVHYLGAKTVSEVPKYIDACDVCMMPNDIGSSTVPDCDSIKLYEYLACGRPIVSTDVPSVRRFGSLVRIAHSHVEFIEQVEEALREDPRIRDERKAVAREHSWQRRVELMSRVITSRLSTPATVTAGGALV
jgi:glycosyltransferase involved in cell wall biosynthesis